MKKQVKALALTIALLTTTACGAKTSQVEAPQVNETKVTYVAKESNIQAPKTNNLEKEQDNRNYLIPQTIELKDEKAEAVAEATTAVEEVVEVEETTIAANNQKQAANEVEVEETKEEVEATVEIATIDNVSRTSESLSLPNPVEETVASAAPVAVETVEETVAAEEAAPAGGLTVQSPSAEEVRNYWRNHQSQASNTKDYNGIQLVDQETIFDITPNADLTNLNLGQVSQAAQADALHIANTARYALGLNEMTLGANQSAWAQAATMVNRQNLAVSHNPQAPAGLDASVYQSGAYGAANSNLAASFGLLDSVVEYLKDDLGSENQLEAGHRRWIINPSATAVGFGQTEEFNAMYVNNNDYAGQNKDQVVAYPGQTAISEFHSQASSLSIQFGENFDITNAQVEVTDLATGEVRTDAHIDQSFKGNSRAITFGNGMNYAPGTKLAVKVTGVTKNGEAYPVEYTINYMSIR